MDRQLIGKVINQVAEELKQKPEESAPSCCGLLEVMEFIETTIGDTTGLVIASVDPLLVEGLHPGKYRSTRIIGGRMGASLQIMAVDDVAEATNTEVISIEFPRDTKGGAGHGSLIHIGTDDVSDAKRAVGIALAGLNKYFGDVYANEAGHLGFQYTTRASYYLGKTFGTPLGRAFSMVCAGPAVIVMVLADVAIKTANVEIVSYSSPSRGASYSNEVILTLTGDSGAVRQAVRTTIEIGRKLLGALGSETKSTAQPYIQVQASVQQPGDSEGGSV